MGYYSLPGYFGALNYIESDIEVSKHVLGNAQTGFSASKLITLPNGEPSPDEKRAVSRQFDNMYTGADGKKYLLAFVNYIFIIFYVRAFSNTMIHYRCYSIFLTIQ